MAILGQKRLFWARKWKIGPKFKFYFQHLLEMTHSWFLAIFGLPRTIFVKVVPILSSNFNFGQIFTKSSFLPKTPHKTAEKIFFRQFCNFFSKSIHIWSVLTNFWQQKLFWLQNIAKILISLDPPNSANFEAQNPGKGRKKGETSNF